MSNIFSSLGSLVGMVVGGPAGAALGSGLGTLLGGGSMENAVQSGIGGLFTGGTMGQTGLLMNALNGGGGNAAVGNQLAGLFTGNNQSNGAAPASVPGQPGANRNTGTSGILSNMFSMPEDPLMNSLMREYLYKQRRPPDYANLLTPLQQKQLATFKRIFESRASFLI